MASLVHQPADPQQELLRHYCAEAEMMLRSTATAADARQLGDAMCSRFEQECSSPLVVQATRAYIGDIIRRMFGDENDSHRTNDQH